jgi:hypothetical protein
VFALDLVTHMPRPQQPPPLANAVCILGMHRSGTSALARVLNLLGMDLGRQMMNAGEDNPSGFWENAHIVQCHVDLVRALGSFYDDILPLPDGWHLQSGIKLFHARMLALLRNEFSGKPLWGFKDPRTCRLGAMWHKLFAEMKARPGYVLMIRHPDEIAASMAARDGQGRNQSLMMTLGHLIEAERQTRGRPRVVVSYDQVMADWRSVAERIGSALQIQWPRSFDAAEKEVTQFLDPSLRHHRAANKNTVAASANSVGAAQADARIARWAFDVHELLTVASNDEKSRIDVAALDQIAQEFKAALPEFAGWRASQPQREKYLALHLGATRLDEEIKRLKRENQGLREEANTREA